MSRTRTVTLTVGSLAVGALLATGVTGLALADDEGSTSTPSSSAAPMRGGSHDSGRPGHGPGDMGRHMGGGHGPEQGRHAGPAGEPLHGEMVVKADDGTFVTERMARGTVTAVSATSITVKAEDGYTATFAVDSGTEVHVGLPPRGMRPGNDQPSADQAAKTIADVSVGDVADVRGTVSGSTATATHVMAMTAAEAAARPQRQI